MSRNIEPGRSVHRSATVHKGSGASTGIYTWCLSDNSVDQMGDTIAADGWVFDAFDQNPVVQFGHNTTEPPIGRVIRHWTTTTALYGDIEFAPADISPFAHEVEQLVANGFMNAGSVGFMPLEYRYSTDKSRPNGIDFVKQALLEFSIVPVPANGNALLQAQSKGLNVRSLRGGVSDISAANAKRLREWARDAGAPDPAASARMAHAIELQRSLGHPMRSRTSQPEPEPVGSTAMQKLRSAADLEANLETEAGRRAYALRLASLYGRPKNFRADVAMSRFQTVRW